VQRERRTAARILKGEWAFDGIVISDWFGTYTPNAATGGLDLEMPGPARWMGQHVLDAIESGAITEAMVDDRVRRLLRTIARAGAFEHPEPLPEQAIDKPEHRRVARQAAAEAAVLLKNAGNLLPLDREKIRSVAVIGENAMWAQIEGGQLARHPSLCHLTLRRDHEQSGRGVAVEYELGCPIHKMLPLLPADWLTAVDGQQKALTAHYFDSPDLSGEPANTETLDSAEVVWFGTLLPHVTPAGSPSDWRAPSPPPRQGLCFWAGVRRLKPAVDRRRAIDRQLDCSCCLWHREDSRDRADGGPGPSPDRRVRLCGRWTLADPACRLCPAVPANVVEAPWRWHPGQTWRSCLPA